jgi:hypothetical protein
MTTATFMDKYIFWETNSNQIAGDSEYMSEWNIRQMPRLGGAVPLNLAGLPENKYGLPIGLSTTNFPGIQHGGEDTLALHVGEQDIDYGDEQIYGPEDDPIDVYDAEQEDEEGSTPVASVVDAMLYDEMLNKVSPNTRRRSKHTKRTVDKPQHKKTKKGRYAK